jgi:uncharacterized protein (DUF983 family)
MKPPRQSAATPSRNIFYCPACGKGKLFKSLLTIAPYCSVCGLDFTKHEQGDGPAFFGILFIGALTTIFAAIVEIKFAPSFWLHAALWIPFIIIGSIASLRVLKAALISAQYHYRKDNFET